jgi:hypothetical protein
LLQKRSSTISRRVALRPRTVICFSAPVRRKLRLLPRLCHPPAPASFVRRPARSMLSHRYCSNSPVTSRIG